MQDKFTLHLGDCIQVLSGMTESSVDLVVTDPPYFLPAKHYATRREFPRTLSDLSALEFFYFEVFKQFARILKPTGVVYMFCDGQSYPVFFSCGYRFSKNLRPIVWDKQNSINGYSWRHQHELILFAEMDESPNVATGDGDIIRFKAVSIDDRDHPAEKPVGLIKKLIKKSTSVGQIVLDPFTGSGSTGEACAELGRYFIGIEKERDYYDLAMQRISSAYRTGVSKTSNPETAPLFVGVGV